MDSKAQLTVDIITKVAEGKMKVCFFLTPAIQRVEIYPSPGTRSGQQWKLMTETLT